MLPPRRLATSLVPSYLLAALLAACADGGASDGSDGKADDLDGDAVLAACQDCRTTLHACIAGGDDASSISTCIQAFAACVVEESGESLVCHDEATCGECLDDCGPPDEPTREACLLARSECIALALDETSLDASCPGDDTPVCADCTAGLGACLVVAPDPSAAEGCRSTFASCFVSVTDEGVVCVDEAICGECLDDCGPAEEPTRRACLIARSACIVDALDADDGDGDLVATLGEVCPAP